MLFFRRLPGFFSHLEPLRSAQWKRMGADEDRAPEDVAAGDGEEASAGGKKGRYRRDKPWVSPTAVAHRRQVLS